MFGRWGSVGFAGASLQPIRVIGINPDRESFASFENEVQEAEGRAWE
jgi:hypothetical protein